MEAILNIMGSVNDILWGVWTPFVLLSMGIFFTVWTRFTQYKAMTHGIQVIRGQYDDPNDPGAINHFQALSAALSATVGLGNIGGVALAIAAGGPGAVFWMWIVGFFGMALKTVEISLAMMYRNIDDPDNPHGGAMWVVEKVIGGKGGGWKIFARFIGIFFCITLIISTFTGGNMFQTWNVAALTHEFFGINRLVTGVVLAAVVGLVIIGGIKRIGTVAGKLVPFMCVLYVLSGLTVVAMNITGLPEVFRLIITHAFSPTEATGAFLGGSIGWAFMQGLKRGLFSNEAGQGSAPIAHAAAKTNEPSREGIVGGIGPFIDTICICTLTASVILLTGAWNRDALLPFGSSPTISPVYQLDNNTIINPTDMAIDGLAVSVNLVTPLREEGNTTPLPAPQLSGTLSTNKDTEQLEVVWATYSAFGVPIATSLDLIAVDPNSGHDIVVGTINEMPIATRAYDLGDNDTLDPDDPPLWGLLTAPMNVEINDDNQYLWENIKRVFTVVEAHANEDSNKFINAEVPFNRHELSGTAHMDKDGSITVLWGTIVAQEKVRLAPDAGLFRKYSGAPLTAHAFDRQFPGLGKYLVTFAAWLFAISTMISWSYYGEQGMIYMVGNKGVLPYKLVFLALAIYAAAFIVDTGDMETLMDLGTGAMLWSNLPIILCLGFLAVRNLKDYNRRHKAGEFKQHK